jgi:hypothetical protein
MKIRTASLFLVFFALCSCGRRDHGQLINNTNDTLTLTLKLNYPANEFSPDNYFREQIANNEKSQVKDYKLAGDCMVAFDAATNMATLKLNPKDKIDLGTIRIPLYRSDYRTWEFTEIHIKGNNFEVNAKDRGIMNFIEKEDHWFGQDTYSLVIGTKSKL